jgi:hypothetical protein
MKKTTAVIAFFVAAVLAGLFLRWSATQKKVASEGSDSETESTIKKVKEKFMQREVGMPLDMEPVKGAVGVAGYNGTPPLLGSEPKAVPERPYDMADDTQLFSLANNKMGADCCPSPFSGDQGCICLTDEQRAEFASRGGNRSMA